MEAFDSRGAIVPSTVKHIYVNCKNNGITSFSRIPVALDGRERTSSMYKWMREALTEQTLTLIGYCN